MPSRVFAAIKGILKNAKWIKQNRPRASALAIVLCCILLVCYFLLAHYTDSPFEGPFTERAFPDACFDPLSDEEEAALFESRFWPKGQPQKFLTSHPYVSFCSGLGNQMFRFASLYGLGRQLGRFPAFTTRSRCPQAEEFPGELEWLFPFQAKIMRYNPESSENYFAKYFAALDCCHFDDPSSANLSAISAKNLFLGAIYLQNFRYFHAYREEIWKIFRFSPSLCTWAMNERRRVFGKKPGHNLCVHTRRGDFFARNWQSTEDLTLKLVAFSLQKLRQKLAKSQEIAVLLIGDDQPFLHNLALHLKNSSQKVFISQGRSRGEDLAFAVLSCDSLLISASASTFAWWIGYLMRDTDGGHVFFNANFTGMDRDRANFLPGWIPIGLEANSGKIRQFPLIPH